MDTQQQNDVLNFAFDDALVRVVMQGGEPWFVAADVCRALGIKNARDAIEKLDPDERAVARVGSTDMSQGERTANIICEGGLYKVAFTSRKPEAKQFTRWVTHDVLPSIRRTGRYEAKGMSDVHTLEPDTDPVRDSDPRRWPVMIKLSYLREARMNFGVARSQAMFAVLGLPLPPSPPTPASEALACLRHLLMSPAVAGSEEPLLTSMIGAIDEQHEKVALVQLAGLRPTYPGDAEGFFVANMHPRLAEIFSGTQWQGRYTPVLRRLPGASAYKQMRIKGQDFSRGCRGTFIPADYLDEERLLGRF